MVNGEQYAWEDLQVAINGVVTDEVNEVEYTVKKDFTEVRGRGAEPLTLGRGNKSYDAKVVVLQSFVEGVQRTLPRGKDLTDIEVEVTCSYAPAGGVITTDQITRARITEVKKAFKNGDGNMVIELPLKTPKILYNI